MFQRPFRALSVSAPVAALALIGLLLPSVSAAQDRTAQQIKLRQSVYTVLGAQVTMMGAMASGRAPFDAASFKTAAQRAAFMASIAPDVFPAGSQTDEIPLVCRCMRESHLGKMVADAGLTVGLVEEARPEPEVELRDDSTGCYRFVEALK